MITQYDILRRPILSEKSNLLKTAGHQVTLEVLPGSNKKQIKSAAQTLFGVKVLAVNTSVYRGKTKRMGKSFGKCSNWKKAVLTLSADSDLDVFGVWQQPAIPEDQAAA
ncbi:MAG: 50S ribosomal protein L23 [Myxococcaceae bacterium]